jgi:hypothetical protein
LDLAGFVRIIARLALDHIKSLRTEAHVVRTMVSIASPRLKQLLSDWESWRRGREFPSRADFSPLDLKYILGNLSLLNVTYNPLRFRYRVHATNLSQRMIKDMTNKSIDDIPVPDHAKLARSHLTEVVQRRVPVVCTHDSQFPDDHLPHDCEVLGLPLSSDGKTIDMLMSAMVWGREEWTASPLALMQRGQDSPRHRN